MFQNSKNVYFSETKAPQGASRQKGAPQTQKTKISASKGPLTSDLFKDLPPQNKFTFMRSSKIHVHKTNDSLLKLTDPNPASTENPNCPHGP